MIQTKLTWKKWGIVVVDVGSITLIYIESYGMRQGRTSARAAKDGKSVCVSLCIVCETE